MGGNQKNRRSLLDRRDVNVRGVGRVQRIPLSNVISRYVKDVSSTSKGTGSVIGTTPGFPLSGTNT